ncbi:phosphomannomutase [Silicimonas algicola]|uniref:Phosphomannomutase n=1 Tax=Silicimonas algicola TaxID=1826607 RepID=A0A316G3C0_9RHOB|nr:phosphomannomutase [Silicimonas algicola]AZQ67038.1 phosphomannomutase [Silicimonas algicola]PWK55441.1 phosphomannomutase [Silicimonas algicola]
MAPKFGTSGLRGLATELTDDLVARYAAAFVAQHDHNGTLYVGRDRRESSPRIALAVARGAAAEGLRVIDCGVLPTPALAGAALEAGTLSIMVTGSHIPGDRNGLKFYTSRGEFTKADEAPLAAAVAARRSVEGGEAEVEVTDAPRKAYVARYVSGLPHGVLAGRRVGVWVHSSTASEVLPDILEGLGAAVVSLGASETFVPVDTEAVDAETRSRLAGWVAEHGLDAVVSTDGDADRPLFVDDRGRIVPGDILGPIAARWCGADEVVTTVSANSMVDLMGAFHRIQRTKIGSPHVIAAMEARMAAHAHRVAGYEPNGGFLLGWDVGRSGISLPSLMTRDAVLPIVATLAAAAQEKRSVSELIADLPARRTATDRLQDVDPEVSRGIVEALLGGDLSVLPGGLGAPVSTDTTDGARLTFADGRVVHIRPSGNAPELRAYVEADSDEAAGDVLASVLEALQTRV